MQKLIVFALSVILLLSSFVSSSAQRQPEPRIIRLIPPQEQEKDDYRKNLDLVRELIRAGKPGEALRVLEQMKGVYGETRDVHQLTKEAYLAAKEYDTVEQIIKNDMTQSPDNWRLHCELADLYFKSDRGEEARWNLNRAIELIPDRDGVYKQVATVYLLNGLTPDAMDTYKLARMRLGEPSLFALELAGLYEALLDYKQAVDEYFLFMGDDSTRFTVVEDRIDRIIQTEQNLDQVELALGDRIRKNSRDIYSHKLYGDLLFRTENLEAAFETFKKVDELSDARGKQILTFIRMCHTSGYYEQAAKASQYLVSSQPSREAVVLAKVYVAYSQEGQEKYEDAIQTYQSIIDEYVGTFPLEGALAQYKIGEIKLFRLKKPDEAFVHFQSVISDFRDAPQYADALVRLGDCMMARGDLDSAGTLFDRALKDPKADPRYEELRFKLVEIDFYRGDFEQALDGYNGLIAEFPKGLFVNNALERVIVIGDNQELDRPLLAKFAEALLDNVQGNVDSAVRKLDGLISAKSPKLSDLAQLEKAKILKGEKEFDKSLKALNELLEKYPQSLFRAQAQMLIGDLYNYHLNDKAKAIDAYQKLLKDYERSVYVDEVRDRLRELKAELPPASSG